MKRRLKEISHLVNYNSPITGIKGETDTQSLFIHTMQPKRPNLQQKRPTDSRFQLMVTIARAEVNQHASQQQLADHKKHKNIYLFDLWRGNHSWLNRINCLSPTKLSKTFGPVDSAPGSSWCFVTFIVKRTIWNIRRRLLVVCSALFDEIYLFLKTH